MTDAVARRERRYLFGYSSPAIVVTLALVIAPLLYAVVTSFFRYSFANPRPTPIAFDNYVRIFTDPALHASLGTTALIVVPAIVLEMVLGVAWALAINSLPRARAMFTTILALPVMVSGASVGMAFRFLFTAQWGPVDALAKQWTGLSLDWLGDPSLARLAIVIADVWQNTPFVMLIALAALAGIPREINEAANVDGASGFVRFTRVTLPLIRKFLIIALLFRLIDLFRIFDVIFVMTNGGPASTTETVSFFIYRQGVQFFDIGYAAAMGLVLAAMTVLVSAMLIRVLEGRKR